MEQISQFRHRWQNDPEIRTKQTSIQNPVNEEGPEEAYNRPKRGLKGQRGQREAQKRP